jgi:molecular chaperone GrpE
MTEEKERETGDSSEQQAPPQAPQPEPSPQPAAEEEEKQSRFDAAKAFFRALHAGQDELPDLGITGAPEREQAPPAAGPCRNCQFMETELSEARQKLQESETLYKRMMADFDNFRRRVEREREEFQSIGIQRAVESVLPALDDMDRALSSLTAELPAEKILESVKLVSTRLQRCLEQIGVKPLSVVGEHFDPKYHEPVQEVETTEVPHGAVVHELRRGYTLNDKVIRPALVNVASNLGAPEKPAQESEETPESPPAPPGKEEEKVYDLSHLDDSEEAEQALNKSLDEYLETPASGNRAGDE